MLFLAAALLLGGVVLWGLWPTTVLEIREGKGGRLLDAIPVATGERITYSYRHSVQKTRVDEVLEVAPGHLVVRETVYDVTGAGLPSDVLDGDLSIDPESGRYRISNMSREMPWWPVRVAFTAEQTLEAGGKMLRLDSLAPPTSLLAIDVASHPRLVALFQ